MKTTLLTALILLSLAVQAQTRVTKDASGNYTSLTKAKDTSKAAQVATFTDSKGIVYPVYKSVNSKLFYNRTSKAGNVYKVYLKEN